MSFPIPALNFQLVPVTLRKPDAARALDGQRVENVIHLRIRRLFLEEQMSVDIPGIQTRKREIALGRNNGVRLDQVLDNVEITGYAIVQVNENCIRKLAHVPSDGAARTALDTT